jgi:hypothetical protein
MPAQPLPANPARTRLRTVGVVVVGASAGGVEALARFVSGLPADLAASVFVVLHMPVDARSMLPLILSRSGPLPAVPAEDGAPIEPGRIYVAVPDRHLLVEPGRIRVLAGPRENSVRPAIDPLFRSAAWSYRDRVAGIVLSGVLDDGTEGLHTIKRRGGLAIVQDPADAICPAMPENAMRRVDVDYRLPAPKIGPLLATLARPPSSQSSRPFQPSSPLSTAPRPTTASVVPAASPSTHTTHVTHGASGPDEMGGMNGMNGLDGGGASHQRPPTVKKGTGAVTLEEAISPPAGESIRKGPARHLASPAPNAVARSGKCALSRTARPSASSVASGTAIRWRS